MQQQEQQMQLPQQEQQVQIQQQEQHVQMQQQEQQVQMQQQQQQQPLCMWPATGITQTHHVPVMGLSGLAVQQGSLMLCGTEGQSVGSGGGCGRAWFAPLCRLHDSFLKCEKPGSSFGQGSLLFSWVSASASGKRSYQSREPIRENKLDMTLFPWNAPETTEWIWYFADLFLRHVLDGLGVLVGHVLTAKIAVMGGPLHT